VVTAVSIMLGVISVQSAVQHRPIDAAWWALLVTLTDKLDGFLANALHATSPFGVQLDSLADLVAFGVAPATVFYGFFTLHPALGWVGDGRSLALRAICCVWTIAVAVRLARFNVMAAKGPARHYTGTPSTMTAGIVVAFLLLCLKYADPQLIAPEHLDRFHLLGALRTDGLVPYLPFVLLLGAVGMLSGLRVPKLGRTFSRVTDVLLLAAVLFGYTVGVLRHLPEVLVGGGIYYLGVCVAYHLRTRAAGA
jgi:CDP-diacylglycerol--serine O-phosphatidyltransferase